MTETRTGQFKPFEPHPAHRTMTPADASVFADASHMLGDYDLAAAIRAAGGDAACLAHFSREKCGGRPVAGWGGEKLDEEVRDAGERCGGIGDVTAPLVIRRADARAIVAGAIEALELRNLSVARIAIAPDGEISIIPAAAAGAANDDGSDSGDWD